MKDNAMSQFKIYGETDQGRVRENNQDSIEWYLSTKEDIALAILADGVGGFSGGEVASRLAVEHAREEICRSIQEDSKGWRAETARMVWRTMDAIAVANSAIHKVRSTNDELGRMGTTIVLALAYGENLCIAHIGDSRCYRYRHGELQQLTVDHSMAQELLHAGAENNLSYKNVLTRTLGIESCVEPEVTMQTTEVDDIYLLCSDGLSSYIKDKYIENILKESDGLSQCVSDLVKAANAAGGSDNVSVVLVKRVS